MILRAIVTTCDCCGTREEFEIFRKTMDIVDYLEKRGWKIVGFLTICPKCDTAVATKP